MKSAESADEHDQLEAPIHNAGTWYFQCDHISNVVRVDLFTDVVALANGCRCDDCGMKGNFATDRLLNRTAISRKSVIRARTSLVNLKEKNYSPLALIQVSDGWIRDVISRVNRPALEIAYLPTSVLSSLTQGSGVRSRRMPPDEFNIRDASCAATQN
jgi:hypothetical protein